jgi:hypothetical protein
MGVKLAVLLERLLQFFFYEFDELSRLQNLHLMAIAQNQIDKFSGNQNVQTNECVLLVLFDNDLRSVYRLSDQVFAGSSFES